MSSPFGLIAAPDLSVTATILISRPYFSISISLFMETTFETPIPTAPKPMIHNFIKLPPNKSRLNLVLILNKPNLTINT